MLPIYKYDVNKDNIDLQKFQGNVADDRFSGPTRTVGVYVCLCLGSDFSNNDL